MYTLLRWYGRSHLNPADRGTLRHSQYREHDIGYILGCNLPTAQARSGTEIRIYTAWHDIGHADLIFAMIQHHRFGEAIQPELGRIVSCATCKWILPGKAADVDDRSAASWLEAAVCLPCSSRTLRSRLVSSVTFQSSKVSSATGRKIPIPALFTRMSNPPYVRVDEAEES